MSQLHPSDWKIKKATAEKHCQTLMLPLGPGVPQTRISTKLFNKIYELWGTKDKPHHDSHRVGIFAQALRELRSSGIDLRELPQVNARSVDDCYDWLDAYELKLVEHGLERQKEDKALTAPQKIQLAPESSPMYRQVFLVAIAEYIRMAGPMGDAKQIVEKAEAVARACTEE